MAEGWERTPRSNPPVIDAVQRASSLDIIEESYPTQEAHRQASRCLRCNVNTVFDTSICIACNGCVDVCPMNIIKLVGLSELCKEDRWLDMVSSSLEVSRDDLRRMGKAELDSLGGVMLKDETTCIRCAMCASRCPTHAIMMKKFEFYRECVTVPTRNEKILYHADGNGTR
jgi:formate dehydrogenase (NADP+) beta subunit